MWVGNNSWPKFKTRFLPKKTHSTLLPRRQSGVLSTLPTGQAGGLGLDISSVQLCESNRTELLPEQNKFRFIHLFKCDALLDAHICQLFHLQKKTIKSSNPERSGSYWTDLILICLSVSMPKYFRALSSSLSTTSERSTSGQKQGTITRGKDSWKSKQVNFLNLWWLVTRTPSKKNPENSAQAFQCNQKGALWLRSEMLSVPQKGTFPDNRHWPWQPEQQTTTKQIKFATPPGDSWGLPGFVYPVSVYCSVQQQDIYIRRNRREANAVSFVRKPWVWPLGCQ